MAYGARGGWSDALVQLALSDDANQLQPMAVELLLRLGVCDRGWARPSGDVLVAKYADHLSHPR